jgi:hypothetical protein
MRGFHDFPLLVIYPFFEQQRQHLGCRKNKTYKLFKNQRFRFDANRIISRSVFAMVMAETPLGS